MVAIGIKEELQKIGLNILICRRERNISQIELSQVTGLSRSLISNMERGKANFRIDNLMVVAKGLNVDYRELLN